jgi:hypothetical protein
MTVLIVLLVALAVIATGLFRRRLTLRSQAAADERETQKKLARSGV